MSYDRAIGDLLKSDSSICPIEEQQLIQAAAGYFDVVELRDGCDG